MNLRNQRILAAAVVGVAASLGGVVHADTLQFKGVTDNAWDTVSNWYTVTDVAAGQKPEAGDVAAFTDLAAGSGPIAVNAGAGQIADQLLFGVNTVTATNPILTRDVTLSGGPITLNGTAGGGGNLIGLARPAGNTGAATINNDLVLNSALGTEQRFNIENGSINTAAGPITINGAISGTAGLRKVGAGTLVLNGNTNYQGLTTVQTGTVEFNGTTTAGGGVIVQANGRLAGLGTIAGNVAIGGTTATVAPGTAGVGTATLGITGNAAFQNSTLALDLNGPSRSDLLDVDGLLSVGAGTRLAINALQPLDDPAYILATYGTLSGAFAAANVTGIPAGYELQYNYNNAGQLALVAVPEPAFLMAAPLAAVLLRRVRRQRSS
ncbi:MAG TPA: autotransporter-associated beta strand repeat-containing protein [Tepidisphaeraceae bacterium]|jgi:autotransporter-associated beta strand protein